MDHEPIVYRILGPTIVFAHERQALRNEMRTIRVLCACMRLVARRLRRTTGGYAARFQRRSLCRDDSEHSHAGNAPSRHARAVLLSRWPQRRQFIGVAISYFS